MQYVTIVGARPQFIKAAPLSQELRRQHREFLIHTGQHYDDNMSDVFFRELGIPPPDRHLGVGSGPHGQQTAAMLIGIEQILEEIQPDVAIVYGDTNSTLAGALAAVKMHIPVAHVEAGLRSFSRGMPEEINRIVTDSVSTWLFAPSQVSVRQLASEGVARGVHDVGDVMADCVRHFAPLAARSDVLSRLGLHAGEYYVATVHRASNTDEPSRLADLLGVFRQLPYPVVFPVHPRTRAAAGRHGLKHLLGGNPTRLMTVEPLGYLDMLQLQRNAAAILTDSGGMQKEAYYLGVPCVTLREETEWVETVEAGWNQLAGTEPSRIVAVVEAFRFSRPERHPVLYGDGTAAAKIARILGDRDG